MATRPAFWVDNSVLPREEFFDFTFHNGFSISQKQRSIRELHNAIKKRYPDKKILEISRKSELDIGRSLSAFNLKYMHANKAYSLENIFQSSKVFNDGGPYRDLLYMSAKDAKTDPRIKIDPKTTPLRHLIRFDFEGETWDLEPKTAFYDWIYIKALSQHSDLIEQLLTFDCFTDIEFNPQKSLNCQARSAALFVSLYKKKILEKALKDKSSYLSLLHQVSVLIQKSEQQIYKQGSLL